MVVRFVSNTSLGKLWFKTNQEKIIYTVDLDSIKFLLLKYEIHQNSSENHIFSEGHKILKKSPNYEPYNQRKCRIKSKEYIKKNLGYTFVPFTSPQSLYSMIICIEFSFKSFCEIVNKRDFLKIINL